MHANRRESQSIFHHGSTPINTDRGGTTRLPKLWLRAPASGPSADIGYPGSLRSRAIPEPLKRRARVPSGVKHRSLGSDPASSTAVAFGTCPDACQPVRHEGFAVTSYECDQSVLRPSTLRHQSVQCTSSVRHATVLVTSRLRG
jgi:hypothetical protein